MFELLSQELHFDELIVNDAPTYRSFIIRNASDSQLTVTLSSTVQAIQFQVENENERGVVDNTAEMKIFDEIGVISEVSLAAHQSQRIVASFTPKITLFENVGSTPVLCSGWVTVACGAQVERIAVIAKLVLSTMVVAPTQLQCSVFSRKSHISEFSVTNMSSTPLAFVVRLASFVSRAVAVELSEPELAASCLNCPLTAEPHGTRKFFLIVHANADGVWEERLTLQCDNLRDSRSSTMITVHIVSSGESRIDLVSFAESTVEFGDVCRGATSLKELSVTNVSSSETNLKIVRSKSESGCDVCFCVDEDVVDEISLPPQKTLKVGFQLHTMVSNVKVSEKLKMDVDLLAVSRGRQQLVSLRCTALLHSSSITVSQPHVNFGDCQVGQSKTASFTIENLSPLPGVAVVQLRSKIVSLRDGAVVHHRSDREQVESFTLPARGSRVVDLTILPQRVNPMYRKQITVVNSLNAEEKFIINIEANNMAPKETKLHDDLYLMETVVAQEQQLRAIAGTPLVVPHVIRSKAALPLTLFLSTTSPEIDLVIFDGRLCVERLEEIMSALETVYEQTEETNCEIVFALREELLAILSGAKVVDTINLLPAQELTVYSRVQRTSAMTDFQSKEDGISVRVEGLELPRFVRLSYRLCSTQFDVPGQRTKNFGDVNLGEKKATKLSVVNKCKSLLFFTITKSRSVTASHVRIGRPEYDKQVYYGTVRPFATKDVDVLFHPGIKGTFDEKLRVSNVLYPVNDVFVTVKAQVTKQDTFDVAPESWSFGEVTMADEPSRIGAKFTVTNTSRSKRDLRIRLEGAQDRFFRFDGVDVRVQLDVEHVKSGGGSSRKIEEQIEKLEQKLKIYVRKQKLEKIDAARKRIDVLRRALQGEEVDIGDDQELSSSEDEGTRKSRLHHTEAVGLLARDGVVLPTLLPSECVLVTIALTCSRTAGDIPLAQSSSTSLMIFEAKDQETYKVVPLDLTLLSAHSAAVGMISDAASKFQPVLVLSAPAGYNYLNALMIPIHNALLNDWAHARVTVSSTLETTFVALEPTRCGGPVAGFAEAKFKLLPRNGVLRPGEAQELVIECFPKCPGPQRYVVPVKNIKNPSDVQYLCLELNPAAEEDPIEVEPKVLDFQRILTPVTADVVAAKPFVVRSKVNTPLVVLCRSNKPSQIMLFRDAAGSELFSNPGRIAPKGILRLYCKFVPSLRCTLAEARAMVGGIVIECIEPSVAESYSVMASAAVRVQGIVGRGDLAIKGSQTLIDLGVITHAEKAATAAFAVVNLSHSFPVSFKCASSSPFVTFDKQESFTVAPGQEAKVNVTVRMPTAGLLQESVVVTNSSCSQEPFRIAVVALKQDGAVSMPRQELHFPIACIERCEGTLRLVEHVRTSCTLANHCSKDLILVAKTSAPIVLGHDETLERRSGGMFRVDAKHQINLECTMTDAPQLTEGQVSLLFSHKLVSITASAQFEVGQVVDDTRYSLFRLSRNVPAVGQCVLVPKFLMRFAVSECHVEPTEVDVGTVGRNKQEFSFKLVNVSPILPLVVSIVCEPTVRIAKEARVEPGCVSVIKATLDVASLRIQGPFKCEICFVNTMNCENEVTAVVSGRYFHKLFQITNDGSRTDDESKNLVLPPLLLSTASAIPSFAEVKLSLSCSEPNIQLTLRVEESVESFGGLLRLQVLAYDATDLADSLTFCGKPHNLRIRCTATDANLSKLLSTFFGTRGKPQTTFSFEEALEIEKWRSAISPQRWLGRVVLVNSLATDEEIQVFGAMQAVTTFAVPSSAKVMLKRVSVDGKRVTLRGKVQLSSVCTNHTATVVVSGALSAKFSSVEVIEIECTPARVVIPPGGEASVLAMVTCDLGSEAHVERSTALALVDDSVTNSGYSLRFGVIPYEIGDHDPTDFLPTSVAASASANDATIKSTAFGGGGAATTGGVSSSGSSSNCTMTGSVLEIHNCTPVAGVEGSFACSLLGQKDTELVYDIRLANASASHMVEFTAQVISQSPHPWLQLSASNGRLRPLESQSIRISAATTDVGTYFAHILVANVGNAAEVVILRVTGEVYAMSGDGLYEIMSPQGARLTTQQITNVFVGTVFGEGQIRSHAFEIVNRSGEPLEFQLSIVKALRFYRKQGLEEAILPEGCNVRIALTLPGESVHHNYVVVEPKSRQKVQFLATVERLGNSHVEPSVAEMEVAIKCRTVRDVHHVVRAKLEWHPATVVVHPTQVICPPSAGSQSLAFTVTNRAATAQAFALMSDSTLLVLPAPRIVLGGATSENATSTMNVTFYATRASPSSLERGIEEHFFVYSVSDPRERVMVLVSTTDTTIARPLATNGYEHERLLHTFARRFLSVANKLTSVVAQFAVVDEAGGVPGAESQTAALFDTASLTEWGDVVLEACWINDEIQYYSMLLRNSRSFASLSSFFAHVLGSHPLLKAYRAARRNPLPPAGNVWKLFDIVDVMAAPT